MRSPPPTPTLFPYTTLFRSHPGSNTIAIIGAGVISKACARAIAYATPGATRVKIFDVDKKRAQEFGADLKAEFSGAVLIAESLEAAVREDRKSTRLNSSHVAISYAVFCLKKK